MLPLAEGGVCVCVSLSLISLALTPATETQSDSSLPHDSGTQREPYSAQHPCLRI